MTSCFCHVKLVCLYVTLTLLAASLLLLVKTDDVSWMAAVNSRNASFHQHCNSATQSLTGTPGIPVYSSLGQRHTTKQSSPERMHIAIAVCSQVLPELYIRALAKSIVLFVAANQSATLHVFTNMLVSATEPLTDNHVLRRVLDKVFSQSQADISYAIYPLVFPTDAIQKWAQLFRSCSSQRLFLADALPRDVTKVIYLDIDVIFLGPVSELWREFDHFDAHQMSALAREATSTSGGGGYSVFARHPFPPPSGLNSGVMLMHLSRLRHFPWTCVMRRLLATYESVLLFGDQDLLNIFFYFYPSTSRILPCHFNFRQDQCNGTSSCPQAVHSGIVVLHGNRHVFATGTVGVFKHVFNSILNATNYMECGLNVVRPGTETRIKQAIIVSSYLTNYQ